MRTLYVVGIINVDSFRSPRRDNHKHVEENIRERDEKGEDDLDRMERKAQDCVAAYVH